MQQLTGRVSAPEAFESNLALLTPPEAIFLEPQLGLGAARCACGLREPQPLDNLEKISSTARNAFSLHAGCSSAIPPMLLICMALASRLTSSTQWQASIFS